MGLIFGCGDHGVLVLKSLELFSEQKIDGFLVDCAYAATETRAGLPVHIFEEISLAAKDVYIGFTFQKKKGADFLESVVNRCVQKGAKFPGFNLSKRPVPLATERGAQIFFDVSHDFFCRVGAFTQVRPNVTLGHNVTLEEFCYVAPGAQIGSNSVIGSKSFIGAFAKIAPESVIGPGSVIGFGATVGGRLPACSVAVAERSKSRVIERPYRLL